MSTFNAPVVAYAAEDHPNADALELAVIGGWRAATRIGQFSEGQKVAYIPEGSVVPWDLVEELGLADPPLLAGPEHNRVKAIRLRGVLSQGLVYAGDRIARLSIGDDATEALGLVKWVPPVPVRMAGTMVSGPQIVYDIDNIKAWPDRMVEGETSVVTEKLHGTFCCMGLSQRSGDDEPTAVVSSKGHLSRGRRFDLDAEANADNLYVKAWRRHADAIRKVFAWRREIHLSDQPGGGPPFSMFVLGEIFGRRVQDLPYGQSEPSFRIFDVRQNGSYLDWTEVEEVSREIGVLTVPVLEKAPWSEDLLRHTDGTSTLAWHHREGIVVRPVVTRYDYGQEHESGRGPGRMILKSISEKHLLRKGGTEYN